jgi:hypothetical protein
MHVIIEEFADSVSKITITEQKLFVAFKTPDVYADEFNSICMNLHSSNYKLKSITTDDDNNILLTFDYIQ